jgi:hypothetical protein
VGLPGGMNGRQLADAARRERPDLKVDTGGEFRRPVRRPTAELQSVTCAFWL